MFRGLTGHLWHLWELAVTGEAVLVVAPTPAEASNAVLALVSLVAPLPYAGEFRPYFTLYDRDCGEVRPCGCACVVGCAAVCVVCCARVCTADRGRGRAACARGRF